MDEQVQQKLGKKLKPLTDQKLKARQRLQVLYQVVQEATMDEQKMVYAEYYSTILQLLPEALVQVKLKISQMAGSMNQAPQSTIHTMYKHLQCIQQIVLIMRGFLSLSSLEILNSDECDKTCKTIIESLMASGNRTSLRSCGFDLLLLYMSRRGLSCADGSWQLQFYENAIPLYIFDHYLDVKDVDASLQQNIFVQVPNIIPDQLIDDQNEKQVCTMLDCVFKNFIQISVIYSDHSHSIKENQIELDDVSMKESLLYMWQMFKNQYILRFLNRRSSTYQQFKMFPHLILHQILCFYTKYVLPQCCIEKVNVQSLSVLAFSKEDKQLWQDLVGLAAMIYNQLPVSTMDFNQDLHRNLIDQSLLVLQVCLFTENGLSYHEVSADSQLPHLSTDQCFGIMNSFFTFNDIFAVDLQLYAAEQVLTLYKAFILSHAGRDDQSTMKSTVKSLTSLIKHLLSIHLFPQVELRKLLESVFDILFIALMRWRFTDTVMWQYVFEELSNKDKFLRSSPFVNCICRHLKIISRLLIKHYCLKDSEQAQQKKRTKSTITKARDYVNLNVSQSPPPVQSDTKPKIQYRHSDPIDIGKDRVRSSSQSTKAATMSTALASAIKSELLLSPLSENELISQQVQTATSNSAFQQILTRIKTVMSQVQFYKDYESEFTGDGLAIRDIWDSVTAQLCSRLDYSSTQDAVVMSKLIECYSEITVQLCDVRWQQSYADHCLAPCDVFMSVFRQICLNVKMDASLVAPVIKGYCLVLRLGVCDYSVRSNIPQDSYSDFALVVRMYLLQPKYVNILLPICSHLFSNDSLVPDEVQLYMLECVRRFVLQDSAAIEPFINDTLGLDVSGFQNDRCELSADSMDSGLTVLSAIVPRLFCRSLEVQDMVALNSIKLVQQLLRESLQFEKTMNVVKRISFLMCLVTSMAVSGMSIDSRNSQCIEFTEFALNIILNQLYTSSLDVIHISVDCLTLLSLVASYDAFANDAYKGVINKLSGAILEQMYFRSGSSGSQINVIISVRLLYCLMAWISQMPQLVCSDLQLMKQICEVVDNGIHYEVAKDYKAHPEQSVDSESQSSSGDDDQLSPLKVNDSAVDSSAVRSAAQHVLWQLLSKIGSLSPSTYGGGSFIWQLKEVSDSVQSEQLNSMQSTLQSQSPSQAVPQRNFMDSSIVDQQSPLNRWIGKREAVKVALIYVGSGQDNECSILQNDIQSGNISSRYEWFAHQIGKEVELSSYKGYVGGLERSGSSGRTAICYHSDLVEIVYHDVTRMPSDPEDPRQIKKKRHIGNDHVHIVWDEHSKLYRNGTIAGDYGNVVIIIRPPSADQKEQDYFTIRIYKDSKLPMFGPLLDGSIVHAQSLASLVRSTAVNAYRATLLMNFHQKESYVAGSNLTKDSHYTSPMLYKYPFEDRERQLIERFQTYSRIHPEQVLKAKEFQLDFTSLKFTPQDLNLYVCKLISDVNTIQK
ncbi:hypothetical protein MP228_000833 [Amoeboaphelidium protococcarum]|nr:hypothetical protein MP228_000833 [Amoeboaphelidium protococcarum]